MKLKVILADDHAVVRMGLQLMLKSSGIAEVVAQAKSPSELLYQLSVTACDVIVTDFCMPDEYGRDGLSLIERLTRLYPSIPVVIITALRNAGLLGSMLQHGISGLIHKDCSVRELAQALHAASQGRRYIHGDLRSLLPARARPQLKLPRLSRSEMEVLRLFAREGLSAQQIAARLQRSPKTVSRHKRSAQAKLGLKTDQELLDYCRRVDSCMV